MKIELNTPCRLGNLNKAKVQKTPIAKAIRQFLSAAVLRPQYLTTRLQTAHLAREMQATVPIWARICLRSDRMLKMASPMFYMSASATDKRISIPEKY